MVVDAARDFAMLPGAQRHWVRGWLKWPQITISGENIGRWPFSPDALVKLASFLICLSWPTEVTDSISYVELLILYERWAGERLPVEDSVPKYRRPGRPISVSAAPLCPDVMKWKLCQYLGCMMRALGGLLGGLGRFIPGRIGANHGRLRHIGWEKRPRESSGAGFFE